MRAPRLVFRRPQPESRTASWRKKSGRESCASRCFKMPQDASSKDLVLKWVEHDLTALVESFPERRWRSCAWLQLIIDMMESTWVTIYTWERFKDGKRSLLHGRSHLSSFCPNDMSRNKQGLNFSPRDRITACQAPAAYLRIPSENLRKESEHKLRRHFLHCSVVIIVPSQRPTRSTRCRSPPVRISRPQPDLKEI